MSTPVILNGVSAIPPATGINYSSWFAVGFIFQYLIRKRNFAWWAKFNYVTSAAFDCGTVISLIFIFFTLQFPKGGTIFVNCGCTSEIRTLVASMFLCECPSSMFLVMSVQYCSNFTCSPFNPPASLTHPFITSSLYIE
ncbi:oligopeptide transporter [Lentinula edodes]|uniref:Oligopeptide transporter n=1 Tax=Lentinula edodes TaxID=5353 RepID=A0A1Q3ERZ2_LENED|nr:oligopeptide transporter [Lentinula edodes]